MPVRHDADVEQWLDRLQASRQAAWQGTFRQYLPMVIADPRLARRAHARLYDAVCSYGVTPATETEPERYALFDRYLFGVDESLRQVMAYLKAAALGADVRRRILLLYGPPASGKSELVGLLKRVLAAYTHTEDGAVYAIADCPQHEDPLHLLPPPLREQLQARYGISVEGELCPRCSLMVREEYDGDIGAVPVKRIFFSEAERIGIGTFVPSDPKTQDIAELVGSMDLARIGEYGAESDPRAYRFDGELNVANRGLMEFIEMLKADERFLYVLLTLAQEQRIKAGRFPLIYADECIIAHTNEPEFRDFLDDPRSEALRDRIIPVRMPYNLRVDDEVRIYEKLRSQLDMRQHLAPHTLKVMAIFAVLTRLSEPDTAGLTLVKKLKLYNGEDVDGFTQRDVPKLKAAAADEEGMRGLSPRFMINRLAAVQVESDRPCITPIDVLRGLKAGVETHPALDAETKTHYLTLLVEARRLYDDMARNDVQKAFFVSFDDELRALLDNYLDHAAAYLERQPVIDPITGEERPPDERLLRAVEGQIGISENGKDSFRHEILRKVAIAQRRGETFDFTSHQRLRTALEQQLFEERRDTIKLTITARNPDPELLRRFNQVVDVLIEREQYCAHCANQLLQYVASLLARES